MIGWLVLLLGLQSASVELDMLSGEDGIFVAYRASSDSTSLMWVGGDTLTVQLPVEVKRTSIGSVMHEGHEYFIVATVTPDAFGANLFIYDAEDLTLLNQRPVTFAQLVPEFQGPLSFGTASITRYSDTTDPDRYPVLGITLDPEYPTVPDLQVSVLMQFSATAPPEFLEVLAFSLPYDQGSSQRGPVRGSYGHALGAAQSTKDYGGGWYTWMYSWMHKILGEPCPEIPGPLPHSPLYTGSSNQHVPYLLALGSCADEALLLWKDIEQDIHCTTYGFNSAGALFSEDFPFGQPGSHLVMTASPLDDGILLGWYSSGEIHVRHHQDGVWGEDVLISEVQASSGDTDVAVCSDGEDYWVAWFEEDEDVPHIQFLPRGLVTGIAEDPSPGECSLVLKTVPSPFRTELRVSYNLTNPAAVELAVYDITGHRVDNLDRGWRPGGSYSTSWTPSPEQPAGCYTVLLRAGSNILSSRCVLIR